MENSTETANDTNSGDRSTKQLIYYMHFSISTIGLTLNILVIVVITSRPFIRSKISRIFVVNQCVTDALCSAMGMIYEYQPSVPPNVFGELICRLWMSDFIHWGFIQASVNNVMLFTIERYLSIVRPLTHQRLSACFIFAVIVLGWVVGFAINIALLFESERNEDQCRASAIAPTPYAVQGVVTLLIYAFPLAMLIVLYSHMIAFLRRENQRLHATRRTSSQSEVSRDLTITAAIATTAYTLFFAPGTFIYTLRTFGVLEIGDSWMTNLYAFFVNVNFIVNPLIFVVFLRSFRRELRRLFCRTRIPL